MTRYKMIDGVNVPFTAQDDAVWEARKIADETAAPARRVEETKNQRRSAYQAESDHLYLEEARKEVPAGTWLSKVNEIKIRYPKLE